MSWGWSGNIEDLPSPLLNQPARDIPSWALQDLGRRLSRQGGGGKVESWERLAEGLGLGEREVDQLSSPVNQMSAPVNQMSAPVNQLSAPVNQLSAPVSQMLAPENQLSASLNQLSAVPANPLLAPTNQISVSGNQPSAPANLLLSPANQPTAPASRLSTPENQLSAPANQISVPANQNTAPANQLKAPADRITWARVTGAGSEGWPGVAVLQRWAQRPGSTAYVLLHALRQIQREDLLQRMVDTLTGMAPMTEQNAMVLYVSVEDGQGHCRHLHVRTHRKAPLHASLDNVLPSVYWYDITGPMPGLHWCSPSGLLQGVMLTLKQRDSPCQECRNQIYGTCPPGGHASGDGPAHYHTLSENSCESPCGEKADVQNIGVEDCGVSGERREKVTQQYGNNLNISVTDPKQLNISPAGDSPRSPQSPPSLDKVLTASDSCPSSQHLLSGFSSFSTLSSGQIEDHPEFPGTKTSPNIQPPVDSMGTSDTYVKATQLSSLTDAKQPMTEDGDSSLGEDNIKKIQSLDAFESVSKHPGVTGEKDAQTSDRGESSSKVTVCYMYPDYVSSESVNQSDKKFRDIAQDVSLHKTPQDDHLTAQTEGRKDVPVPTGKAQTECRTEKPSGPSPVGKSILHPEYIPPDNIKQLCQSHDTQHNEGECPMTMTKFHNFRGRTQTQEQTSITVVDSNRRKVNRQLVAHQKHVSLSANTNTLSPASAVCPTQSRGCAVYSVARSVDSPKSCRHTASSDLSSMCLAQSASSVTQPVACVASGASFSRRRVQSASSFLGQRESCENTALSEVSFFSNAPFTGSTVRHANSVPKQTSASGETVPSAASYVDQKSYSGGTVQPGTSRINHSSAGGNVQTAVIPVKRASSTGCIGLCNSTFMSQGSTRKQSVQRAMDVRETSARRCHVEYPVSVSQARRSPSSSRNTAAPGSSCVSSDCTDQPENALQRTTSAPGLGGKEPTKTSHHGDHKRLKTPTACLPLGMETSVDVHHSSQQPGPSTKEYSPKPKPCSYTYNITPNY